MDNRNILYCIVNVIPNGQQEYLILYSECDTEWTTEEYLILYSEYDTEWTTEEYLILYSECDTEWTTGISYIVQ